MTPELLLIQCKGLPQHFVFSNRPYQLLKYIQFTYLFTEGICTVPSWNVIVVVIET